MASLCVLGAGPPFFKYTIQPQVDYTKAVGSTLKLVTGFIALAALGGFVAYFLSEPDDQSTEKRAQKFSAAAQPGSSITDAIRASPDFKKVTFGPCGHLESSPDSGPKGSLIFSPATGAFARFTSFDEFISHNPKLLSEHDQCRHVGVEYMTQFPYRGQIDLELDGRGVIKAAGKPIFFN
jgi:hypothetical protein